jgi:hypothetical protein
MADDESDEGKEGEPAPPGGGRLPPHDPDAHETKRFYTALRQRASLVVTLTGGAVAKQYAPALLVSRFSQAVDLLVRDVGGGVGPMLYGVVPGNSMELLFGDPLIDSPQGQLPLGAVREHAMRIANLMESDDPDALFQQALRLGPPAKRYADLARLVESEGVTLTWTPSDSKPVELTPIRAEAHVFALTREPLLSERTKHAHGILYRVFAEPKDDHLGTVGIRLFKWSSRPTGRNRLLATYESPEVGYAIKDGLIGEPVEVTLLIREAMPGTSLEVGPRTPVVVDIRRADDDDTRLGIDMLADLDDEPDES